eukprot:scaffold47229_cov47-Attheya_sp.AAC.1
MPSSLPSASAGPTRIPTDNPSISTYPSDTPSSLSNTTCESLHDCTVSSGNRGIPVTRSGGDFKNVILDYFNGVLTYGSKLTCWNVSEVTDMDRAFDGLNTFDDPLCWDVSSVTTMSSMFGSARAFNQDLSAWDVSSVTDMQYMLSQASDFNQNLCAWASKSPQLALVDGMFLSTSCNNSSTPVLKSGTPDAPHDGPFCFTC